MSIPTGSVHGSRPPARRPRNYIIIHACVPSQLRAAAETAGRPGDARRRRCRGRTDCPRPSHRLCRLDRLSPVVARCRSVVVPSSSSYHTRLTPCLLAAGPSLGWLFSSLRFSSLSSRCLFAPVHPPTRSRQHRDARHIFTPTAPIPTCTPTPRLDSWPSSHASPHSFVQYLRRRHSAPSPSH